MEQFYDVVEGEFKIFKEGERSKNRSISGKALNVYLFSI